MHGYGVWNAVLRDECIPDKSEKINEAIVELLGRILLPLDSHNEEHLWAGVKLELASQLSEKMKKHRPCKSSHSILHTKNKQTVSFFLSLLSIRASGYKQIDIRR